MKNKLFYVITMIVAFALCGCDDDNKDGVQDAQTPVVLMGKAYTFDPDDAGELWKSGKTVGIYMLKENKAEYVEPYRNVKYQTTVQPEGYFTPTDKNDVIYCPQEGGKVDVVAYYPWKENLVDDFYSINVSNQATVSNFSFLYAGNGKGISKDNNKSILQLRPVLSQVIFKLIPGDGIKDEYLKESVITVSGMNTKADFNLLTGQFEALSNVKDITLTALDDENGASGQLLPGDIAEGYEATIELPNMNRTYHWNLSEGLEYLESGIRYICSVRVDLDKIEVEIDEEAIDNWIPGDNHEIAGTENGIQTAIDELPTGSWIGVSDPMKAAKNTWCHQETTGGLSVNVELDEELGRNVIYGNFMSGNTWYRNFIAYRMGDANKQVYTLSFNAKGTKGKSVRCYIKTNDVTTGAKTNVFLANDLGTGDKPYAGYVQFTLSDSYQSYSLDFNFAKMVTNPYTFKEDEIREVTAEALADFYIAFFPTANNVELYLDDIVLKKKN